MVAIALTSLAETQVPWVRSQDVPSGQQCTKSEQHTAYRKEGHLVTHKHTPMRKKKVETTCKYERVYLWHRAATIASIS